MRLISILLLISGDAIIGTLHPVTSDAPYFFYRFIPESEFEAVRPLFAQELALLGESDWEQAYDKIDALGLRLVSLDGSETLNDFLIHIDGDKAWFRY